MAKVITTPYLTFENATEVTRALAITTALDFFTEEGIYKIIDKAATRAKEELRRAAPYDEMEYDDYHMKEHFEIKDVDDPELGKGKAVDSEAWYSGNLEYGLTFHGKHQNWFRPTMYKNQAKIKVDVVKQIARMMMK